MIKVFLICFLLSNPQIEQAFQDVQGGDSMAWARHKTGYNEDDEFLSVATIPGSSNKANGDARTDEEVWVIVDRGDLGTFVEQFQSSDWGDDADYCWFVDSGMDDRETQNIWIPEVPEVIGDYTQYFIGYWNGSNSVINAKDDDTIDTTWGTSGYWGNGANAGNYNILQIDDERLLVSHPMFGVAATRSICTMVSTDGTTDTSWGTNGSHVMNDNDFGWNSTQVILEDADGSFHLFGRVTPWSTYIKIDSTGAYVTSLTNKGLSGVYRLLTAFDDAAWADDDKTRIIAVGTDTNIDKTLYGGSGFVNANMMAFLPNGTVDTSWTGNIGLGGFARIINAVGIKRLSDGGFVIWRNTAKSLAKIIADGSALDTSWGVNGEIDFGTESFGIGGIQRFDQDEDDIYIITNKQVTGVINTIFSHVDSTGTIVDDNYIVTGSAGVYDHLRVFNDKLIFGTSNAGYDDIEIWSQDFTKESGFDIPTSFSYVSYILPDEETRDTTPAVPGYWDPVDIGYSHFEGETVCVYADGIPLGTYTITDGEIVGLDEDDYTTIILGINYYSTYESFPLEISNETNIQNVTIDFYESLACNIGVSRDDSEDWLFSSDDFATKLDPVTEIKDAPFMWGTKRDPVVYLWSWIPVPCTIRAIYPKIGISYE